ncbi:hypothetical protein ACFWPJ_13825, partial [Nocardia sp. NPDC058497]
LHISIRGQRKLFIRDSLWADPQQHGVNEINHNDGGRGVYFLDPNGHFLEMITVPYGGWPT